MKIILCGLLGFLIYGVLGLLVVSALIYLWPLLLLLGILGAYFGGMHLLVKYHEEKERRELLEIKLRTSKNTVVECRVCGTNNRIRSYDPKFHPICAKCKTSLRGNE